MSFFSVLLAITVTISGLGSDGQKNRELIQAGLNKAQESKDQLIVRVPAGTFPIASTLFIYSNTELSLDAATVLTRQGSTSHNMLYSRHYNSDGTRCNSDNTCKHGGYSQFSNIVVSGGKWDAGDGKIEDGGIFHLCHGSNIAIRNVSFTHASGHVLNLSGSKDIVIDNCKFADSVGLLKGQLSSAKSTEEDYKMIECVHLDVMNVAGEEGNFPLDNTVCSNVLVKNCTFSNVYSAVGSHRYYPGIMLDKLVISDCIFKDIYGAAVYSVGVKECEIKNCQADNIDEFLSATQSGGLLQSNKIHAARQYGLFLYDNTNYMLKGNTISNSGRNGINMSAATATIDRNEVTDSGLYPLLVANRSDVQVIDSAFVGSSIHGVCILSGSSISLRGGKIAGFPEYGIAADGAKQINVQMCTIEGGKYGFYASAASGDVVIKENVIDQASIYGILVTGKTRATICDNKIVSSGLTALYLVGAENSTIEGNYISNAGSKGIWLQDATSVIVEANTINDVVEEGLYCLRSSSTISYNTISESGKAAIRVEGSSARHASAAIMKNQVGCSSTSAWQDIWLGAYCDKSCVKENVMKGKGLRVDSMVIDKVDISDICTASDRALLSYYEIIFRTKEGEEESRMICRRDKVYRIPSSRSKGRKASNGRIYDDDMLVVNLAENGMMIEMFEKE